MESKILQQKPEERAVTRAMLLLFRAEYADVVEKTKTLTLIALNSSHPI